MNDAPSPTLRRAAFAMTASLSLLAGCGSMGSLGGKSGAADSTTAAPAASSKVPPGMNDKGEVVDSSKVEAGHGQQVKGIGDWQGEITGKPGPGSKFTKLQIGMGMKQVTDLAGPPTDQGAYITGKAFIPWYFGSDKHRFEMVFKGQGRLIFASSGGFDFSSGNLIWIIHNPNEPGYR